MQNQEKYPTEPRLIQNQKLEIEWETDIEYPNLKENNKDNVQRKSPLHTASLNQSNDIYCTPKRGTRTLKLENEQLDINRISVFATPRKVSNVLHKLPEKITPEIAQNMDFATVKQWIINYLTKLDARTMQLKSSESMDLRSEKMRSLHRAINLWPDLTSEEKEECFSLIHKYRKMKMF
ncbi:hypothetical protein ROZALSC1DRAFT_27156 [Rozella allomycis CSF55]|uniref:Uncharacterized protein n=1 Tax=Rozella allomycis (strain CSF55) TaxID=988480 RepID=A0A075AXT8_ROZAC|nr:hypothetical protein O9G_003245 [Rozella allomycis CSF55]RKP21439.1 hypothetical protein ROZALSC1DRAFT_27156 [Rozella allomycis CSF55]|eukprot:EPZ33384.1 hypothetical protein O9G_003245 [Rozella allomycis CSF55]